MKKESRFLQQLLTWNKKEFTRFVNDDQPKNIINLGMSLEDDVWFSYHELVITTYLLEGFTPKAAAKKLKFTDRTMETYIQRMKVKLGCHTNNYYDFLDRLLKSSILLDFKDCYSKETINTIY